MNPADVKMNHEPMSEQFPNRVRVQPLLPLPNTTIPGKNRKKRRVVKIAIGDEIPLELNHCLDGVTTPAKPSGSDFNQGNNTTETGVAEEQQLYRKLDYPAVNINNNDAPSPLSSMLISDSKPAVSSVVSPNAGSSSADPATLKMQKGVSFLHEDNHHLDNTLPNSDQSTEKDQTTAVNQKFLEREVCTQCQISAPTTNQDTQLFISHIISTVLYVLIARCSRELGHGVGSLSTWSKEPKTITGNK